MICLIIFSGHRKPRLLYPLNRALCSALKMQVVPAAQNIAFLHKHRKQADTIISTCLFQTSSENKPKIFIVWLFVKTAFRVLSGPPEIRYCKIMMSRWNLENVSTVCKCGGNQMMKDPLPCSNPVNKNWV